MAGFGPGVNGGSLPKRFYSDDEIAAGLLAMIAWAGNATKAAEYLEEEKDILIPKGTLSRWKIVHAARYDELRDKYAGEMEERLAHNMRDAAALAIEGTREAVDLARERLASRKDEDPARTAANLSRVAQSSTDKLLALTGRPSRIVETRGAEEVIRSLVALRAFLRFRKEPESAHE